MHKGSGLKSSGDRLVVYQASKNKYWSKTWTNPGPSFGPSEGELVHTGLHHGDPGHPQLGLGEGVCHLGEGGGGREEGEEGGAVQRSTKECLILSEGE